MGKTSCTQELLHMVKLVADFGENVSVTFNVVDPLMKQLIDCVANNTIDKWCA